jgi:glycosyltransferase involved in cell wall biosynthesis
MRLRLVLAGKPWTREMKRFVQDHDLGEHVLELRGVSNQELQALYSTARGLLFPSLYEGFGWPVIEAQACGCPVFTTNRPPMTEIGGSNTVYIDPQAPEQAAECIAKALTRHGGGGEAAILNAKRFTDKKMINEYIHLYGELLYGSDVARVASEIDGKQT